MLLQRANVQGPKLSSQSNDEISERSTVLEISELNYSYGKIKVIDNLSLSVNTGEFITILGPSGAGKSTLLRIIAGLEMPERVRDLRLSGQSVIGLPANRRSVSTVFQHYALFPHMSVGENVEYGLRLRGVPQPERSLRAKASLDLVRLTEKYSRKIQQLSGGEQQRVAIARSLVIEPDILLLDEPLGSLDERLREDMQLELVEIRRKTGRTFILVTHSQGEAITMSDRVVLMRSGKIEQIGTPKELFEAPATVFAARFMGVENVIEGVLLSRDGQFATIGIGTVKLSGRGHTRLETRDVGSPVFISVRAESVQFEAFESSANGIEGRPGSPVFKGRFSDVPVYTNIGTIIVRQSTNSIPMRSNYVTVNKDRCVIAPID
jgi:spermidine/putrescine transport system ATP-binding protein